MRRWIICILLVGTSALHAQARSEFADIAAYLDELDRLHAALTDATPEQGERLSVNLAPRWTVRTPDGLVAVDLEWLVHGLRDAPHPADTWPTRRGQLLRRILQLQAHGRAVAESTGANPVDLRSAVTRVLAEGEFSRPQEPGWR